MGHPVAIRLIFKCQNASFGL